MNSTPPPNERTPRWLARMELAIWVLIYAGLLAVVLGGFVQSTQDADATGLFVGGGVAVVAGLALIYLRSRLPDEH